MPSIVLYKKPSMALTDYVTFDDDGTANRALSALGPGYDTTRKFATLETDVWKLDGTYSLINDGDKALYWSWKTTTDAAAKKLTIKFNNVQTGPKYIRLVAADPSIYPTQTTAKVYLDDTLVSTISSAPNKYINSIPISNLSFDKVVITFDRQNVTGKYIRIADIQMDEYDIDVLNYDQFYDVRLVEEISLVSDTLPINSLTFTLNASAEFADRLSNDTCIDLYTSYGQFGTYFLKDVERQAAGKYKVTAQDAIGVLENTDYMGNLFLSLSDTTEITVKDVIDNIMSGEAIAYEVDPDLDRYIISIKLAAQSKRAALAQILFVANAVCLKKRNGLLWFGKVDGTNVSKPDDITDKLFTDIRIIENAPVASIQMGNMTYSNGAQITTGDLNISIESQTQDYIRVKIQMPTVISSTDLEIDLRYTLAFYQDVPESAATVTNPYVVHTGIRNYGQSDTEPGGYKYMPEKFNIGSREIIVQLDRDTISQNRPRALNAFGEDNIHSWGGNVLQANTKIHPYLDFTTATFFRENLKVTYYEMDIADSETIKSVSNTNVSTNAFNAQDLTISTIDIADLKYNGEPDNTLDYLMQRCLKFSKTLEGTILTEGHECGDTVQMTLPELGLVRCTITQLDYYLTNKLIAKSKMLILAEGS